MIRTQVQFTPEQLEALKTEAARRKSSVSALVRKAVEAWVGADPRPTRDELKRRAIEAVGRFGSGHVDIGARHDEHLSDVYGG